MEKYKKLKMNSVIFAIGNFGSSILSFLMIPLYTSILSSGQYGVVDFLQSTVMLVAPIVGLSLYESVLRFSMEYKSNKSQIVSTSLFGTVLSLFVGITILTLLKNEIHLEYTFLFSLLLGFTVLNLLIQNYTRSVGFIKTYAVSGIITTIILVVSNIVLLFIFKLGVEGFLVSLILSLAGSILINGIVSKFFLLISFKQINATLLFEMFKYSIPLIPNSISWWLISDVNKFFIVFYIGAAANGQFAIASKPGAILALMFSIFAKSWQLSATEEIHSSDRHKFFSDVFEALTSFHFMLISIILVSIEPIFLYVFPKSYGDAWTLAPTMLMAVMFANFAAFIGVNYLAGKKTVNVLYSTIMAGMINVLVNWLLIPNVGLHGAALGSVFAFLFLFIFRLFDTRKFVLIRVNFRHFIINILVLVTLIINVIFNRDLITKIMFDVLLLGFEFLANKNFFNRYLNGQFLR